ncbi:MAG: ABC transporter ATP-binding protein [Chloroflexi bacterium]|nr:ABC transporter ATP-binding protein [Chloroflexota bacterium]
MPSPLLQIRDATKIYYSGGFLGEKKSVVALDNFNMTIGGSPATITTIAGESGSGKTTLANLVLGFIKLTSGRIIFDGEDITDMDGDQLKTYRRNVQAVFQDPFGVYNPFYRIDHVFDLVNRHFSLSDNQSEYRDMVEAGLNVVGLYGEDVLRKYPHQLSGGQRQRIMMARAYMIKPRLIVADEPVSMVDASLRASILDAMLRLRDEHGISFLYITHDLSTAYQIGDEIYMLYQGTIAERGTAMDVIDAPQHPYVQLLIDSVPVPDPTDKWDVDISLPSEEEMRTAAAQGCRYYPRCPHRMDKCLEVQPPLFMMDKPKHEAACYLYDERDVAPQELSLVENRPKSITAAASSRSRNRERIAAAVLIILGFALGVILALNREPETIVETVVETVVVTAIVTPEEAEATATAIPTAVAEPQPAAASVVVPDFVVERDGALDKGAIRFGEDRVDEIADASERHSYSFQGSAGETLNIKLVTGGAGLSGTGFYAPLATLYAPDGAIVFAFDQSKRSLKGDLTLAADGTYHIVIGADERGRGVEGYTISIESDAPQPTPLPTIAPPDFVIEREGAVAKGVIVLGEDTGDEIQSADDRHSYSFEGVAGSTVDIKLITGGRGLSGTGFFAPLATIYAPDGSIVFAFDNARRSNSGTLTFGATGIYEVLLGADDRGRGVDAYTITITAAEG